MNLDHQHLSSAIFSEQEIMDQTEGILRNSLFAGSQVLQSFLKFIVTETLAGRAHELKEYTIAVSALGKPQSFNPQTDAIIRIHAGRLRRNLKEYYSNSGVTDPVRIELVKGSYVPVFRRNESEVVEDHSPGNFFRSNLTLAVLPFRNLCPNDSYQFFVDGLGEELTHAFSKFDDLSVIAHYSARKLAGGDSLMSRTGNKLGVHYLITGSVMRTIEEIRVHVGLIESFEGIEIWSKSYTLPWTGDNYVNIIDTIVSEVVSLLAGYYGIIIQDRCKNAKSHYSTETVDAILLNYYFHINFSEENYLKNRVALEKAERLDPKNARVKAMLAEMYLDAYALGFPTIDDPVREGYRLAKQAVELDAGCQHAYQEFAWANIYMKRNDVAIEALKTCIGLNPSSVSSMGTVGFGLACLGEYEEAFKHLHKSYQLNPHCPWWFHLGFFIVYYKRGDWKLAGYHAEKIEAKVYLDPMVKAIANYRLENYQEAQQYFRHLHELYPGIASGIGDYLSIFLRDDRLVDHLTADLGRVDKPEGKTLMFNR